MKLSTLIAALLMLSVSLPGLSQEITEGSDFPMLQTRSQLQTELEAMSPQDRELYRQLNGGSEAGSRKYGSGKGKGRGNGDHQRKRDGSGKGGANRQRSNFGSGYGSGYGSRQGGYGRR